MRVINSIGEDLTSYDLDNGYLIDRLAIRKDAAPIDNVVKFAYTLDDYEPVKMYVPITLEERIDALKNKLRETDYIAIKIAEGASTREEYADVIAQRQAWRDQINELQN